MKTVLDRLVMRLLPKKEPVKEPVAGEEWVLKNDSPWPEPDQKPVKILDVKDGWVRYDMQGICFRDERMVMDRFLLCYRYHA